MNKNHLCMSCMSDTGGERVCPVCGYDNSSVNDPSFLPVKSTLANRFLIGKAYDINGEGVSYSAWDNEASTAVIIREYFPADIASRQPDGSVQFKNDCGYSYNDGLMEFMNISKKLSGMTDLPCLFRVVSFFEHKGSAYRVLESVSGISLMEFLLRNGGSITWEQARPLFLPLITTLKGLHDAGIIHRGISPETIFVGRDGKLRLKNICIKAVRSRDSDITAQLYPGFTAIEQYGFEGRGSDGAWTDVYGLSATLFRVLAGNPPCDATDRLGGDNMTIPAKVAETVPTHVLAALANGLQILPDDRTESVTELRRELTAVSEATRSTRSVGKNASTASSTKRYMVIASACTAGFFIIIALVLAFTVFRDSFFAKKNNSSDKIASVPSVNSVGDVDSFDVSSTEKQYAVPYLMGVVYDSAVKLLEENTLKHEIVGKVYSDTFKRGTICQQSIAANTLVSKETTVQLTISLGPQSIKMPDLSGYNKNDAYVTLLELGFLPTNISFMDMYDEDAKPEAVIKTEPEVGASAKIDSVVKVFINTYSKTDSSVEVYSAD